MLSRSNSSILIMFEEFELITIQRFTRLDKLSENLLFKNSTSFNMNRKTNKLTYDWSITFRSNLFLSISQTKLHSSLEITSI